MKGCWIIILFWPMWLFGQERKMNGKPGWRSIATAGIAAGESGASPVIQLSGGMTYRRFFTGIGFGYDGYGYNSFPLFTNWNMDIGKRRLVFVYAMPGYNIPGKFTKEVSSFRTVIEKQVGGLYMDAGIGYRVPIGIFQRLSFSAGYSRKSIRHEKIYTTICGELGPCTESGEKYRYRYHYGRLTTRLSWEIGK